MGNNILSSKLPLGHPGHDFCYLCAMCKFQVGWLYVPTTSLTLSQNPPETPIGIFYRYTTPGHLHTKPDINIAFTKLEGLNHWLEQWCLLAFQSQFLGMKLTSKLALKHKLHKCSFILSVDISAGGVTIWLRDSFVLEEYNKMAKNRRRLRSHMLKVLRFKTQKRKAERRSWLPQGREPVIRSVTGKKIGLSSHQTSSLRIQTCLREKS